MEIIEVTDPEIAFGTTRGYPEEGGIPREFWDGNNKWYNLASNLFFEGSKNVSLKFKKGVDQKKFFRWLKAHLMSMSPKHELKMAGVGHFMSQHLKDYKIDKVEK